VRDDSRVRLRVISHQAERGEPFTVMRVRSREERLPEHPRHRGAVLVALHVDEVEDDDAAEVRSRSWRAIGCAASRFGLEDRVVEVAAADVPAGVTSMVVSASVWSMIR